MSPRLRPGLVVARRDDRHLQLGLEPPHRVILPDVAEIRRLLDALAHGRPVSLPTAGVASGVVADALARIERADLLDPGTTTSTGGSGTTVSLDGPRALVGAATPLLRAAGVRLAEDGGVRLLLAHTALPRDRADPLVRDGIPHLVAAVTPWGWEVGPFVVPGETACLRCVDAAATERDPRHGVVLDQLTRPGVPPSGSAALQALALGWVVRDLLAYERGARPTTWSATVRLLETPGEEPVSERRWLRHPHCGCAWDALTG